MTDEQLRRIFKWLGYCFHDYQWQDIFLSPRYFGNCNEGIEARRWLCKKCGASYIGARTEEINPGMDCPVLDANTWEQKVIPRLRSEGYEVTYHSGIGWGIGFDNRWFFAPDRWPALIQYLGGRNRPEPGREEK